MISIPPIPQLPLKTIFLVQLFFFLWSNFSGNVLPAAWLWSNIFVLALLLRLVDAADHSDGKSLSEILLHLYLFTIVNDVICFIVSAPSDPATGATIERTAGQKFCLAMACIGMICKPFFAQSLLADMVARGGYVDLAPACPGD